MMMQLRCHDSPAASDPEQPREAHGDPRFQAPASSLRILQLGPSLEVRGGISSVERLIAGGLAGRIAFRHVPTMVEGSALRRLIVYLRAIRETARELRAPGPLLVHVHFSSRGSTLRKLLLALMVLASGRPLLMHAHGGAFDRFFARLPSAARGLVARLLQRADCCVVLSRRWRDFFVDRCGVAPAKARILANPVRVPRTLPDRRGRKQVQFLFLGRIGRGKGAFDLVRAFAAQSPEMRARARLVLAGDGEVEPLRRLAAPLSERVTILSWVDDQQRDRLLRDSDVFVLPSHAEGMPMALLEAMAWGLPVITTAVGGIPDVVTEDVEGLVVSPGNVAQIASAMARMIDDELSRERFARAARARAESLDVACYIEQLLELYRTVSSAHERRA